MHLCSDEKPLPSLDLRSKIWQTTRKRLSIISRLTPNVSVCSGCNFTLWWYHSVLYKSVLMLLFRLYCFPQHRMLTNSIMCWLCFSFSALNYMICFNTYCLWIQYAHCTVLLFLDFFSVQMSSSEFTKALSAVLFFTFGVNCFVQFNNSPKRQIPHTPMQTTARCIDALMHSKHPNMNALYLLCILYKSNLPTTAQCSAHGTM